MTLHDSSGIFIQVSRAFQHRSKTNQIFLGCDEGWVFGIAILLYIDKGVPIWSAGFQQSPCKFGYTTIFYLPCMRIAINIIFLVSLSHVYAQNGFELTNIHFVGVQTLSKRTDSVLFRLWAHTLNTKVWEACSGLIPTTQVAVWLKLSANRPKLNQSISRGNGIFGSGFAYKLRHLST